MPATVAEVVLSGRIAHAGIWGRFSETDRAAATRALEVADLEGVANERVSRLSGGQQQRVLIARAMATEPELMILDEPVSSVDLAHQTMFASLLHEANRRGATVVLVAHALGAMSHLASRAIVLDEGRVVYDGPPEGTPQHDHAVHHHDLDEDQGLRPIGDER
jgi:zinc transport system ATP-binding protein